MSTNPDTSRPLVSLGDYEAAAKERLDDNAWAYIAGGAGDETTLRWNREAFEHFAILPRVLRPTRRGVRGTRINLLGEDLRHPVIVAPVAYHRLAHPDGEIATAYAAAAQEALMTLSIQTSVPMEEVAAASPACRWFQLYFQPTQEATLAPVRRAEAAGYRALVVTVDAPVSGLRNREQRAGFRMPRELIEAAITVPAPRDLGDSDSLILDHFMTFAPSWDSISWLAQETRLPLILKGILSPDDAEMAIDAGAAAIVVSNHGGRTLDTLPATLEVLPQIVARVAGRVPVIVDGGIRRGTDVFKALCLGASAVMIGRPVVHGLAVNGARGVSHILRILRDELEIAMALAGVDDVAQLCPELLWRR